MSRGAGTSCSVDGCDRKAHGAKLRVYFDVYGAKVLVRVGVCDGCRHLIAAGTGAPRAESPVWGVALRACAAENRCVSTSSLPNTRHITGHVHVAGPNGKPACGSGRQTGRCWFTPTADAVTCTHCGGNGTRVEAAVVDCRDEHVIRREAERNGRRAARGP